MGASLLSLVALSCLCALAMAQHGHGGHGKYGKHDGYFQYVNVPAHKQYEFGYRRGNGYHNTARYEQAKDHRFRTRVLWGDSKGGYGEHYWEYNHGPSKGYKGHSGSGHGGHGGHGGYKHHDVPTVLHDGEEILAREQEALNPTGQLPQGYKPAYQ